MTTRSGYAVTIKAFIPIDPSNLTGHGVAISEINAAKALATGAFDSADKPSADNMFSRMEVEAFEVKPVSRRAKSEGDGS